MRNEHMINELERAGVIKSIEVREAMLRVDRQHYIPFGAEPYQDAPQPIGFGATISAPHMHAAALEILREKLFSGARVLDVGSGSGYLTACMAMMVGPTGLVVGIDHIPQLVQASKNNILRDSPILFTWGRLVLVVGDGRYGYPELAPYNVIHVGAASEDFPYALVRQLAPGGRMVAPIGGTRRHQYLELIDRYMDGTVARTRLMAVRFVPLTERTSQLRRTSFQIIP